MMMHNDFIISSSLHQHQFVERDCVCVWVCILCVRARNDWVKNIMYAVGQVVPSSARREKDPKKIETHLAPI